MVAKEGIIADADARYTFDETKLAELRKSSPWKDDPRYFQSVAIGPSAVMKMVSVISFSLVRRIPLPTLMMIIII